MSNILADIFSGILVILALLSTICIVIAVIVIGVLSALWWLL